MRFPERYPILALCARFAVALVGMGCAAIGGAILAGRYACPLRSPEDMSPFHLIWWQHYGWGLGVFFIVFGVGASHVSRVNQEDVPARHPT